MLTTFPYSSRMSHKVCALTFTCSGVNFPVILNECILWAVLQIFTGTKYYVSDMISITYTALECK